MNLSGFGKEKAPLGVLFALVKPTLELNSLGATHRIGFTFERKPYESSLS